MQNADTHNRVCVCVCTLWLCPKTRQGYFNKLDVFALNVNDMQLLSDWVPVGSVYVHISEVPSVWHLIFLSVRHLCSGSSLTGLWWDTVIEKRFVRIDQQKATAHTNKHNWPYTPAPESNLPLAVPNRCQIGHHSATQLANQQKSQAFLSYMFYF